MAFDFAILHLAPLCCLICDLATFQIAEQVAVAALYFEVQRSSRSEAKKEEVRRQEMEVYSQILRLLVWS